MSGSHIISVCAIIISFLFSFHTASATERGIFKGKTLSEHSLSQREKKKMEYEFKKLLSKEKPTGYQKLGGNPWKAKKEKRQRVSHDGNGIGTWGECREYSYKKRGQCYARGGNAYVCEKYYDARVSYCNTQF